MNEPHFRPHRFRWTPETIQRFWESYVASDSEDTYFSHVRGRAILDTLLAAGRPTGPLVDLGCGTGAFLEHAMASGLEVAGMDLSQQGAEAVNARFAGRDLWLGAQPGSLTDLPFENESFDAVSLIETVEHIPPEDLPRALAEVRRILRPNGMALITVPNAEDLRAGMSMCPECGAQYHKIQHLSSFTAESLSILMNSAGFRLGICRPTFFQKTPAATIEKLFEWRHRLTGKGKPPHLYYIGRKPADPPPE